MAERIAASAPNLLDWNGNSWAARVVLGEVSSHVFDISSGLAISAVADSLSRSLWKRTLSGKMTQVSAVVARLDVVVLDYSGLAADDVLLRLQVIPESLDVLVFVVCVLEAVDKFSGGINAQDPDWTSQGDVETMRFAEEGDVLCLDERKQHNVELHALNRVNCLG